MKRISIFIVILFVFFVIFLKTFVFSTYLVNSDSMAPTLVQGDRILCLKRGEFINRYCKSAIYAENIIVFLPVDSICKSKSLKIIKRCVGLPGDTIKIENGSLIVNGKICEGLNSIYHNKINITEESDYRLQFLHNVSLFPYDDTVSFSIINYGPVIVPERGMKVKMTRQNIGLYQGTFLLPARNFVNNREVDTNQGSGYLYFSDNFYFVLGDNFYMSQDSRFWGFLPERNITDRAFLILYSFDSQKSFLSKIRFDRTLKKI